jgi:preprotein translocase subunit SecD
MERAWYWRVALIAGVALLSVYELVPSWYYFRLPPDKRNGPEYEVTVPGWAPSAQRHLNLGLDLQGGIHLAMGVDVDRAVKAKVARRADEIADFLKEKGIPVAAARTTPDGVRVEIETSDPKRAEEIVVDQYGAEMNAPGSAPAGKAWFAFRSRAVQEFQAKAVEQAEKTIRNRVDGWGVKEPDIKRKAGNQIQIQLPGFKDPDKARELLGRTGQLEFKICDDDSPALDAVRGELVAGAGDQGGMKLPLPDSGCWTVEHVELPGGAGREVTMLAGSRRDQLEAAIARHALPRIGPEQAVGIGEVQTGAGPVKERYYRTYLLRAKTELTGDYIADARVGTDSSGSGMNRPVVIFSMSPEGARQMERLTTANMGRRMATVLEGKVETAPYIQGKIAANGQITLGSARAFEEQYREADEIARVLKAGALPAPVTIFEERTVGATLGPELVRKGTTAALVGFLLVVGFMIAYYRVSGLVADLALLLNGLLVLAVMAVVGSTLTLPGIAGFVLTLGMAVDANVLINERIREELRAGRNVKQAVAQGYDKVLWTIVDSHVTTLCAGLVLANYGSGPVRGFAVTLIIGLLASMFTSIVVTRAIMDYFTRSDTARLSV